MRRRCCGRGVAAAACGQLAQRAASCTPRRCRRLVLQGARAGQPALWAYRRGAQRCCSSAGRVAPPQRSCSAGRVAPARLVPIAAACSHAHAPAPGLQLPTCLLARITTNQRLQDQMIRAFDVDQTRTLGFQEFERLHIFLMNVQSS